jgi:tetratricopeptide (TPR) repeat protein
MGRRLLPLTLALLLLLLATGCFGPSEEQKLFEATYAQGVQELEAGYYEEAVETFSDAMRAGPEKGISAAYEKRGDAYVALGDYEEAASNYEQALAADETLSGAYLKLARCYAQLGDPEVALDILTTGLDLAPAEDLRAYYGELGGGNAG